VVIRSLALAVIRWWSARLRLAVIKS